MVLWALSNLILKTLEDEGCAPLWAICSTDSLFSEQQPFFISSWNKLVKPSTLKLQVHSELKENELPQGEHKKRQKVLQNKNQITEERAIENPGISTEQKKQAEKTYTKGRGEQRK